MCRMSHGSVGSSRACIHSGGFRSINRHSLHVGSSTASGSLVVWARSRQPEDNTDYNNFEKHGEAGYHLQTFFDKYPLRFTRLRAGIHGSYLMATALTILLYED